MGFKISLVVPTINRIEELNNLLLSLSEQEIDKSLFEVLVIDQNNTIQLDEMISQYQGNMDIKHFKVDFKGLSRAKNYGLRLAKYDIVSFPDDDCEYYPDTLKKVLDFFASHTGEMSVYGKLYDRDRKADVIRRWPSQEVKVSFRNFQYTYSATTFFTRQKNMFFNESLGAGSAMVGGEEVDYLFRALKNNEGGTFDPKIEVWHPELNPYTMGNEKTFMYARSHGAVIRLHLNPPIFWYFIKSCSFQIIQIMINALKFDFSKVRKRYLALKGRIVGFFVTINACD